MRCDVDVVREGFIGDGMLGWRCAAVSFGVDEGWLGGGSRAGELVVPK